MGGGGGDSARDSVRAQEAAEAERQARVAEVIAAINAQFDRPELEASRQDFRQNVFDLNNRELVRQKEVGDRDLRFHLARTGQAGGSGDVDKNAELLRRLNEGSLRVSQQADEAENRLRVSDEQTRQNLQTSAQAVLDQTTAIQNAQRQQSLNAANAIGSNQVAGGTQLLGDVTSIYGDFQQARGREDARNSRRTTLQANNRGVAGISSGR